MKIIERFIVGWADDERNERLRAETSAKRDRDAKRRDVRTKDG